MSRRILFVLLSLLMFASISVSGDEKSNRVTFSPEELAQLDRQADAAWNTIWTKFYSPSTNLFYDFLTSYEPGKELADLPTPEEVRAQSPNVFGYGTGMEDCMISGGVILSMILDRYAVTGEEDLVEAAHKVFLGIELCATVHKSPGFIARGVSPRAPGLTYINSSRDQVTHAVYSLWEYWRSPLSDRETKARISKIIAAVADRMIKNVTPENDYDFLCSDGSRCRRAICKMEEVMDHETARLPMIYAAAWDVTGDIKYKTLWRSKIQYAIDHSANPVKQTTSYALLQMLSSLDLLYRLEPEEKLRNQIRDIMIKVSNNIAIRASGVKTKAAEMDLTAVGPADWRTVGGLNGHYREIWYNIRESGEIPLTILMTPNFEFPVTQQRLLADSILRIDFNKVSSCGIYDLLGAWWKARRLGYFNVTAQKPLNWKVGISMSGYSDSTLNELPDVKKAGFDCVEMSLPAKNLTDEQKLDWIKKFRTECDQLGLEVWSVHIPFSHIFDISSPNVENRNLIIAETMKLFAWNSIIKAKIFVIHSSAEPIDIKDRPEHIKNSIETFRMLSQKANENHIILAMENLPRTCLANTSDELNYIMKQVGSNAHWCFDTNHLLQERVEDFANNSTLCMSTTHISDYDYIDERHWVPYQGHVDWHKVMSVLVRKGYTGPLMFETKSYKSGNRMPYREIREIATRLERDYSK